MTNKMTKREMFEVIKGVVEQYGNEEMVDFIDHEVELLNKKSANKKPTQKQKDNEELKDVIVEVLTYENKPMTVTQIQKANEKLSNFSNQKISSLIRQLVKAEKVERVEEKKIAYFKVV